MGTAWVVVKVLKGGNILITFDKSNVFSGFPCRTWFYRRTDLGYIVDIQLIKMRSSCIFFRFCGAFMQKLATPFKLKEGIPLFTKGELRFSKNGYSVLVKRSLLLPFRCIRAFGECDSDLLEGRSFWYNAYNLTLTDFRSRIYCLCGIIGRKYGILVR